jgi:hypothetical protein
LDGSSQFAIGELVRIAFAEENLSFIRSRSATTFGGTYG